MPTCPKRDECNQRIVLKNCSVILYMSLPSIPEPLLIGHEPKLVFQKYTYHLSLSTIEVESASDVSEVPSLSSSSLIGDTDGALPTENGKTVCWTFDSKPECVLCYETVTDGQKAAMLTCGHQFHKECIDLWLHRYNHNCPICRR